MFFSGKFQKVFDQIRRFSTRQNIQSPVICGVSDDALEFLVACVSFEFVNGKHLLYVLKLVEIKMLGADMESAPKNNTAKIAKKRVRRLESTKQGVI